MAKLLRSLTTSQVPSGTDFYPELPQHATDNLLLIQVTNDTGGTTLATTSTGWNTITGQADSGASRTALFWKVATSSAEASPLITGRNDDFTAIVTVWSEVDTAGPIHGTARADYTGTTTSASPALTTTVDGCALYYGWGTDAAPYMTVPIGDLSFIDTKAQSTAINCIAGWRNQYAQGAVPSVTMTRSSSTNGGNAWVVAIKNATGGGLRGECDEVCDLNRTYGTWEAGTYTAADTVITDIDGLTTFSTATALADAFVLAAAIGMQVSSSESIAGWVGGYDTLGANKNLSGKILSVRWTAPAVFVGRVGTRGLVFSLIDGTGNWKSFTLAKNKYAQMVASSSVVSFIDVDGGTVLDESGGFDSTDVDKYAWHYERVATTSAAAFSINPVFDQSGIVFVGGNAATPATTADIEFSSAEGPSLASAGFYGVQGLLGLSGAQQLILPVSLQVGDGGTTPTIAKFSGASIETPLPYAENYLWNVADNKIGITVYAGASDSIDFSSTIFRANSPQNFTIHASSSTSATYSFQNAVFIGWNVTWKTGVDCVGAAFSECGEIAFKGADVTNTTITNTASTDAACSFDTDGATVDGCTIDGTGAAYAIELGASVTAITLTDCTITAGSTDKVHVLKASGTVTITISGTTSLSAGDVTTAGATVVISAPVEYQSVTMSNYVTGSRIQVYDTTNSVELYNDIPAAAPQTLWTDSVAASTSGARDIRVRVAYVSGATAKNFIEAAIGTVDSMGAGRALSYRVNQTDDDTYNSNAVDGSAVTGITIVEGATDRVQIAIAGGSVSWASIYAYQCYWLFDATGITDDGAFIEAPDTANYILTGFKIKNTHASIPLVITGGYGVDSTGSVSALYDTTGTSIFPAPAHVVPYATGSGVTPGDVADIASASATAAATAVWDDSKALTVPKFLGLK